MTRIRCAVLVTLIFIISLADAKLKKLSCHPGLHYGPMAARRSPVCNRSFTRLEGVKIGHSRVIKLTQGRQHHLVTKSLKPLVFQVSDFFSSDECDEIIRLAKSQGLEESKTISNEVAPGKLDPKIRELLKNRYRRVGKRFKNRINGIQKFQSFLHQASAIRPYENDARKILEIFDTDSDGSLSEDELLSGSEEAMERFVNVLEEMKNSPRYRARYSHQTWLQCNHSQVPVLRALRERLVRVTQLPEWVIDTSEPLQVVRYAESGHYHGHYDSTEDEIGKNLPCCQGYNTTSCHLCRFMTILFFLNDVTRGGETAFLVAGDDKVSPSLSTNLSTHCNASRLVITPKKGTAVIWYNHFLDPNTGLLSNLDRHSLHGGCDVIEGAKWIANRWINIPKGV